MIYKLNFSEGVIEFVKNHGRAFLEADSPKQAITAARELFEHQREGRVQSLGSGQYVVNFKVALDYKLQLVRQVEKTIRMIRQMRNYTEARYLDRYIMATIFMETGEPDFLDELDIRDEISNLRKAAVVAREVTNVVSFIDYDIAIYNYLELNTKPGFRSRVIRKVKA
jgi:hypothetical protein